MTTPTTPDSVRTDALQLGDQIRHPHDWTLVTVTRLPESLSVLGSPLDFHNRKTDEFERGMRVTGTDASGENVHVDTAPSYLWHREGRQATAPQDDVRAELTAEFVAWLVKKAREHRAQGPQYAKQADVIGMLASKVQRGAVRPNNLLSLPPQGGPEDVPALRAEVSRLSDDVTGACLARYEEEQDNARLRLALASAQRGRRELRARVAELDVERPAAGPIPGEALADVVAAVIRDFDNDAWNSTKDQVAELRHALFEYRDRAEGPAAGSLLGRLSEPGGEKALLDWIMRDDEEPTGPRSDESYAG